MGVRAYRKLCVRSLHLRRGRGLAQGGGGVGGVEGGSDESGADGRGVGGESPWRNSSPKSLSRLGSQRTSGTWPPGAPLVLLMLPTT